MFRGRKYVCILYYVCCIYVAPCRQLPPASAPCKAAEPVLHLKRRCLVPAPADSFRLHQRAIMHMAAAKDGGVLATISEDGVMLLSSLALPSALRGPTAQAAPAAAQQQHVRHQLQVCLMEEQAVQSLLDHIAELKAQVRCCERSPSAGLGHSGLP